MAVSYENRAAAMGQSSSIASSDLHQLAASTTSSASSKPLSNAPSRSPSEPESDKYHHIWLITGPAGCGKSTVAQFIAKTMDLTFIEGDEYHPASNVEKMSHGIPLTDADRWDWLTKLRQESVSRLQNGGHGVVLTCSALKRKYRDVIRVASYYDRTVLVHFVYLHATEEALLARVAARKGHFMAATMVHSQFNDLEEPGSDETDVMVVDVTGSIEEVEEEAMKRIHQAIEQEATQ